MYGGKVEAIFKGHVIACRLTIHAPRGPRIHNRRIEPVDPLLTAQRSAHAVIVTRIHHNVEIGSGVGQQSLINGHHGSVDVVDVVIGIDVHIAFLPVGAHLSVNGCRGAATSVPSNSRCSFRPRFPCSRPSCARPCLRLVLVLLWDQVLLHPRRWTRGSPRAAAAACGLLAASSFSRNPPSAQEARGGRP